MAPAGGAVPIQCGVVDGAWCQRHRWRQVSASVPTATGSKNEARAPDILGPLAPLVAAPEESQACDFAGPRADT